MVLVNKGWLYHVWILWLLKLTVKLVIFACFSHNCVSTITFCRRSDSHCPLSTVYNVLSWGGVPSSDPFSQLLVFVLGLALSFCLEGSCNTLPFLVCFLLRNDPRCVCGSLFSNKTRRANCWGNPLAVTGCWWGRRGWWPLCGREFYLALWQITQAPLQLNSANVLSWRPYLMESADESFVCYHSLSRLHGNYFLRLGIQMFLRTRCSGHDSSSQV